MFETSLVESSRPKAARRWLSLPLSLLVHAVLIGSAMAASVWFVDDIEGPPSRIIFGDLGKPQPPPGPRENSAGDRPAGARPAPATMTAPPVEVPAVLPTVPETPEAGPGSETPGVPGGIKNGDPGGTSVDVPGGVPPRESEPSPILRPGGAVTEPVEISRVQPDYPESARKAQMQGTVVLEAVISRSGAVESVRVLRSVNPLLDASAVKAVSRWRYEPARFDGRPVPVYLTVTVRFQLE